MTINTEWKYEIDKTIPFNITTGQRDIVQSYQAICLATDSDDNENKASSVSLIIFDTNNLVFENFVEMTDLTSNKLKQWTEDFLGSDEVARIEATLIETLENA